MVPIVAPQEETLLGTDNHRSVIGIKQSFSWHKQCAVVSKQGRVGAKDWALTPIRLLYHKLLLLQGEHSFRLVPPHNGSLLTDLFGRYRKGEKTQPRLGMKSRNNQKMRLVRLKGRRRKRRTKGTGKGKKNTAKDKYEHGNVAKKQNRD